MAHLLRNRQRIVRSRGKIPSPMASSSAVQVCISPKGRSPTDSGRSATSLVDDSALSPSGHFVPSLKDSNEAGPSSSFHEVMEIEQSPPQKGVPSDIPLTESGQKSDISSFVGGGNLDPSLMSFLSLLKRAYDHANPPGGCGIPHGSETAPVSRLPDEGTKNARESQSTPSRSPQGPESRSGPSGRVDYTPTEGRGRVSTRAPVGAKSGVDDLSPSHSHDLNRDSPTRRVRQFSAKGQVSTHAPIRARGVVDRPSPHVLGRINPTRRVRHSSAEGRDHATVLTSSRCTKGRDVDPYSDEESDSEVSSLHKHDFAYTGNDPEDVDAETSKLKGFSSAISEVIAHATSVCPELVKHVEPAKQSAPSMLSKLMKHPSVEGKTVFRESEDFTKAVNETFKLLKRIPVRDTSAVDPLAVPITGKKVVSSWKKKKNSTLE